MKSGLVFAHPDGRVISPRLSDWFEHHVEAAGLPRIRLHDLRHSFATGAQTGGIALDASFDIERDRWAIRDLGFAPLARAS
jgi:integrase